MNLDDCKRLHRNISFYLIDVNHFFLIKISIPKPSRFRNVLLMIKKFRPAFLNLRGLGMLSLIKKFSSILILNFYINAAE